MTGTVEKRVYIKTFGCQMNVYDSERMTEALALDGYQTTNVVEDADLVVLNTCHIREKAAEKVYSDLGRLKDIKRAREKRGHETMIAVTGCVAQAEGAEITRRQSAVDLVIGPQSYHRLSELIAERRTSRKPIVDTEFDGVEKFEKLAPERRVSSPSAFLTIQEGCDKFCTFCVVPYTRGAELSRSVADIEREARSLVAGGARELTLLGQNVNAYHGADEAGRVTSLATLLERLAKIDGVMRLRYMTSHPLDMNDALIAAHRDLPQLMPFLHLPVQSGSDRMLAAMNRRHTSADYFAVIDRLRQARPDLALSSDFIVGFPGETEDDADATLALIQRVGFAQAFSFKYSPRPGTPASARDDQVPEDTKTARLLRLQALLERQQRAFNDATVGTTLTVLMERTGREPGVLVGRTPHLQNVHVPCEQALLGRELAVEITDSRQMSLRGVLAAGVTAAA